jgi:hypothetical protein
MQGAMPNALIAVRVVDVGGVKLHYLTAGHGPAIVLLHGYAETSRMSLESSGWMARSPTFTL